jgi:hypothetical protein
MDRRLSIRATSIQAVSPRGHSRELGHEFREALVRLMQWVERMVWR